MPADTKSVTQKTVFDKLKTLETLDDFPIWSIRVKAHLISAGLWGEKQSQPTNSNEYNSLMLSLVSDSFLSPILDQELTTSLVWKTVHALYHVSNLSTKVTSLNQLINIHFPGPTMLENRTMLQQCKRKISSAFGGATSLSIDNVPVEVETESWERK